MKTLKIVLQSSIFRAVLHFPVGGFAAWLATRSWVLCLVFALGFLAYEVLEDWRIADRGYKDVFGFLLGFAAGAALIAPGAGMSS